MSKSSYPRTDDYDLGTEPITPAPSRRSAALAERLAHGAKSLITLAAQLSPTEWDTRIPKDGRTVGVVVHHVASMYPIEIQFALTLAAGKAIEGVTWNDIHALNARHAVEQANVNKDSALRLLRANSDEATAAVRALSDRQLDQAAPVSLNANAPLTCQFFIEDHALRHSYHHLARIRETLGR